MSNTSGTQLVHQFIGTMLTVLNPAPARRSERGLSQSTENAVLLAGAVTIALIVVAAITTYVKNHLPK